MKRFRVKTEYKIIRPTRHRYFNTQQGTEQHIIKTLDTAKGNVWKIALYDTTRQNEWGQLIHGGHIGQIGGAMGIRSDLMAIAHVLQSAKLAELFGLHENEW